MSMRLVCDCECHEQDYYDTLRALEADDFLSFADRDICSDCLRSCARWQPRVNEPRETPIHNKFLDQIYGPIIEEQLTASARIAKFFEK